VLAKRFFFRRLETLPALSGKFRLNVRLPILFDDRGEMEVDFLCLEARIVIEIDGSQHLGDAAVYRRDRRKDALLQSHGYLVLRFLADDLGKELEAVLDAVLRVMARRVSSQVMA
jgi:very-short-patch-repair endonuclease